MITRRFRTSIVRGLLVALLAQAPLAHAGPFEQGEDGTGTAPPLVAADTKVRFRLILPLRNELALDKLLRDQTDPASAQYHQWLSAESFADRFLPTSAHLLAVSRAARSMGFAIISTDRHSIVAEATAARIQSVFGTQLRNANGVQDSPRPVAPGPLVFPPSLAAFGALTPAFTNVVRPKPAAQRAAVPLGAQNRVGRTGPYWFTDLKQAYDYPAYNLTRNGLPVDGTGASVAVLMSGDALNSDIGALFQHEKWSQFSANPIPTIQRLLIDGGPTAGPSSPAFVEAALDIQMILGGAPGAATTLVEIPDLSDSSIIDGLIAIVDSNSYDIVSMSIGGPQNLYLPGYNGGLDYRHVLRFYDALFKQGCAQGITFIAGSGDQGGLAAPSANYFDNDPNDHPVFVRGVSFLSDSPHVTSVGGGNLITSNATSGDQSTSAYVAEDGGADHTVAVDLFNLGKAIQGGFWGAGGGPSFVFPRPAWQVATATGTNSARTEPDVGMQVGGCPSGLVADPSCGILTRRSAVYVFVGGHAYPVIGTSVAAPEFASAAALFVGQNGRQGNLNPYLYAVARQQANGGPAAFHQGQPAFDGYWSSTDQGPNYNYIFGNGSPDVRILFGFADLPPAGPPGSAANP